MSKLTIIDKATGFPHTAYKTEIGAMRKAWPNENVWVNGDLYFCAAPGVIVPKGSKLVRQRYLNGVWRKKESPCV